MLALQRACKHSRTGAPLIRFGRCVYCVKIPRRYGENGQTCAVFDGFVRARYALVSCLGYRAGAELQTANNVARIRGIIPIVLCGRAMGCIGIGNGPIRTCNITAIMLHRAPARAIEVEERLDQLMSTLNGPSIAGCIGDKRAVAMWISRRGLDGPSRESARTWVSEHRARGACCADGVDRLRGMLLSLLSIREGFGDGRRRQGAATGGLDR